MGPGNQTLTWAIFDSQDSKEVDANLSDSNIGTRKKKNIRNNTFIMNAIIHDTITNNKNIDILSHPWAAWMTIITFSGKNIHEVPNFFSKWYL